PGDGRQRRRSPDVGFPQAHRRQRPAGNRRDRLMDSVQSKPFDFARGKPFPYLLLPSLWASRNRARRRERGDMTRALMFGAIGLLVVWALFAGAFWLTTQLESYEELGDYLLRLGLSWLFLTFLSFLAFSGVVTSLSTFFLSEDLRLLLTAPVPVRRLFHARFLRTVAQSSWMVVIFLAPVLMGVGRARCAGAGFYVTAVMTTVPFAV